MIPLIVGANAVGGIANYFANMSANERARALQDKSFQDWMGINIPDPAQQRLAMQQLVSQGTLTPQLENAIRADPSKMESIVTSERDKSAQNRALQEMQEIGNQGGLRLQDKAALQDAMMSQQIRDRANREAIGSDMERRGLGGSGFDVASQLQAQQGTSDQAGRSSLTIAAQAQDRALQALMGAGDLSTKYRTQEFGEKSDRARAADQINLFNTRNQQDVQMRNVGSGNRAQEMNLSERQRIADQNARNNNYAQEYNAGLVQKQFENQMARQRGAQGVTDNKSNLELAGGRNAGNFFSNMAGGIADAATVDAQNNRWDKYFGGDSEDSTSASDNPYSNQSPATEYGPKTENQTDMQTSIDKIKGDVDYEDYWNRKRKNGGNNGY